MTEKSIRLVSRYLPCLQAVLLLAALWMAGLTSCKRNSPPNVPLVPEGPSSIGVGDSGTYVTRTSDLDGDSVAYQFDWGDGSQSDWSAFAPSWVLVTSSHAWKALGTNLVRSRARDRHELTSEWSRACTVNVQTCAERWRYDTGAPFITSACPAIGPDGTVYVGTDSGYLCAINSNGTLKRRWRPNAWVTGSPISTPSIGSDGSVWFKAVFCFAPGSVHLCFYNITPEGNLQKWREICDWDYSNDWVITPVISGSGGTFYAAVNESLYAISSTGLLWCYRTGKTISSAPAIGVDGTIYVGSRDGYVYAINRNGTLKWRQECEYEWPVGSIAIGSDGAVFVGKDYLYAVNPDGSLRWKYETEYPPASPVVGPDGTVYVGSSTEHNGIENGYLYAVNADGTLRWRYHIGSLINSSPAISANGTIYVASTDSLFAINLDGTLKWSDLGWTSSAAIGADGTVFVTGRGVVCAIAGSSPLATSAWPKLYHDNWNTSCADGGK